MKRLIFAVFVWSRRSRSGEGAGFGQTISKLVVRNVLVVEGNGTPAAGPKDILIENGAITQIASFDPAAGGPGADFAASRRRGHRSNGRYVLPGFINLHAHLQEERAFVPMARDYVLKCWLMCGITTVRDVGRIPEKTLAYREMSRKGEIAAPRIFVYPMFGRAKNAEEAIQRIRQIKQMGADGVKFLGTYRDVLRAALNEAHRQDLRAAHHIGVEETTAWDDIQFGITSIEHWYGIPDAAFKDRVQQFPSAYNYANEADRFRYAGRIWREADWDKLTKVLDAMVERNIAWDPTLDIYEAGRDLQRARIATRLQGLFAPRSGGILLAEFSQSRLVLRELVLHRRSVLEGELPDLVSRAR